MSEIRNIELMVKSELGSDSSNGEDPTYITEKFALYARYTFDLCGKIYNETVFIGYLFQAKKVIETGIYTIDEITNISNITKSTIDEAIEKDLVIKRKQYCGENLVNNKLNSIFHCETLPYPISDGREKEYTIIKD